MQSVRVNTLVQSLCGDIPGTGPFAIQQAVSKLLSIFSLLLLHLCANRQSQLLSTVTVWRHSGNVACGPLPRCRLLDIVRFVAIARIVMYAHSQTSEVTSVC